MHSDANQALQALFDRYYQFKMETSPEWATYEGDHRYNERLSDLSDPAQQARYEAQEGFLREVQAIPLDALNEADQLNHDLFQLYLGEELKGRPFDFHLQALNQINGLHTHFPQIIDYQPLQTPADFQAYFSRLRNFGQQISDTIANLRLGVEKGLVEADFLVEQTLPQMTQIHASAPEQTPFWLPLLRDLPLLPPGSKEALAAELKHLIETTVQPAYLELEIFVRREYLPRCRQEAGIWSLPDGEARYRFLIENYTAPGLEPDEIHALGLAEVERISLEMAKLRRALDFQGTQEEFNRFLRSDARFYYGDKEAMRAGFQILLEQAASQLPGLFGLLPQARCELKEIEAYRAASAPQAYYYPPPQDGSRPGYFYYNAYDLPSRPQFTMTALTLHEAVPGHHLQIALAQEIEHAPYFRKLLQATAYVEGWGLYAESLGYTMGLYDDPYQHYGALTFEIWRACRLVVDTGLHAKRWSREEAVTFMQRHTANSELDIRSEVDRYIAMPGQALAYKIGELKIKSLRDRARLALGDGFRLSDFHDTVLRHGALSLSLLEKQVDQWLEGARHG